MAKQDRTPNEKRSDIKNPSTKEHWQDQGNRGKQLDPKQGSAPTKQGRAKPGKQPSP